MTQNLKNIIIFVGGVAAGAAGGVLGTRQYFKKKYAEKADRDIEAIRIWYDEQVDAIINYFPEEDEDGEVISEEEVVEESVKNHGDSVSYGSMYKRKTDPVEVDDDLGEMLSEEDQAALEETIANSEDSKANYGRPPKIISEDSLGELPGYIENSVLMYYTEDNVLTDEDDNVIDDPEYLVGDCLDQFDFRHSDETLIFVRNFSLDTVYEISKVNGAFYDEEDE